MKTFDESFKELADEVKANPDLMLENAKALADYADNELFTTTVVMKAMRLFLEVGTAKDRLEANKIICKHLHSMFHLGLMTGMRMERGDENTLVG